MDKLKTFNDLKGKLSSSGSELESEFGGRLREAIGSQPILQVSRKSGISDSLIRKYLHGSLPGLGNLVSLALATDVRVGWLATGELPKRPDGAYTDGTQENGGRYSVTIDDELLRRVVAVVRESEEAQELALSPKALAKTVSILYRHCLQNNVDIDPVTAQQIVELAAEL